MSWSIFWTDQALRDLDRLDASLARRVVKKLEPAAQDPLRFVRRLMRFDDYKLRIGDYRLIATLVHDTKAMIVEQLGHRSWVYDRPR